MKFLIERMLIRLDSSDACYFHDACTEPADDTVICRFMDMPEFRDLLANEELYLSRVGLFKETDPQEGLPSDEYVRATRGLRKYDMERRTGVEQRSSV